ncbi:MAG: hypothetical protein WC331_11005 [Candidatus Omnitrophota bacterium]
MMFWKRNRVVPVKPTMGARKMAEAFAVDPETPLLAAILAYLAGMEEIEHELIMTMEISDKERTFRAGCMAALAEAQEQILKEVQKANERKRG